MIRHAARTPAAARRTARPLRFVAVIGAVSLLAGPGRTDEGSIELGPLAVDRGMVVTELRLRGVPGADARSSIESGLPITVRTRVEVWRDRRSWFDKQIASRIEVVRIHWDPGERRFVLTHSGPYPRYDGFDRLSDLLAHLSTRSLEIHPRWDLEPGRRYFAIVEVAIQPITLEEFRELDGWIRGRLGGSGPESEPDPDGEEDAGGLTRAVFGFFVDLAGFGDTVLRTRTDRFRIEDLPTLPGPERDPASP